MLEKKNKKINKTKIDKFLLRERHTNIHTQIASNKNKRGAPMTNPTGIKSIIRK